MMSAHYPAIEIQGVIFTPSRMNIYGWFPHEGKRKHFLITTCLTITEAMENERGPEPLSAFPCVTAVALMWPFAVNIACF